MKVNHISDTHGYLPKLKGKFDMVIHTGDLFPNSPNFKSTDPDRNEKEAKFQEQWLYGILPEFKSWIGPYTFLFVPGNHDFIDPRKFIDILNDNGIKAYHLSDKITKINGLNFYGFPYINTVNSYTTWMYEKKGEEMMVEIRKMVDKCNSTFVDVIASHGPIYQCLDKNAENEECGNGFMRKALDFSIHRDMTPRFFLHGHIHEAQGLTLRNCMLVSNAATSQHIINL